MSASSSPREESEKQKKQKINERDLVNPFQHEWQLVLAFLYQKWAESTCYDLSAKFNWVDAKLALLQHGLRPDLWTSKELRHTFLCKFAKGFNNGDWKLFIQACDAEQEGTTTISVKQANLVLLSILQTNKSLEGNRLTWEKAKAVLKAHGCKSNGLKRYGLKDGIESARIMSLPSQERSLLCNDMYKHVAEQIEAHGLTRPLTPEK